MAQSLSNLNRVDQRLAINQKKAYSRAVDPLHDRGSRINPSNLERQMKYHPVGWIQRYVIAAEHRPTRKMRVVAHYALLAIILATVTGCQTPQPITTVSAVDLERFMGEWYVIASIPTFFEKEAFNALEHYQLDPDGTVATRFTFNKGSFDGPRKEYNSRGFVREGSGNAVWGMQFVWPFKAEYRIIYLSEDYSQTVIGRTKRDYVWVMARTPSIPQSDYARILEFIARVGYDVGQLRSVPQQPDEAR
jgi:apolipoprotein D and lipocalin family protein